MTTGEKMYTVADVVRMLHDQGIKISERTIQDYCKRGLIRASKGLGKTSRYHIPESSYKQLVSTMFGY